MKNKHKKVASIVATSVIVANNIIPVQVMANEIDKNNITIEQKNIEQEVNSIDISNGLENATVTSNRGYILGFKIEGVSESDIEYTYTLNNEVIKNNNKTLNFYDKYTVEEVENIIRSLNVSSNSIVKLKITLGNMKEGLKYLDQTGHYYEIVESKTGITWQNAKIESENRNYLGYNGYLAVVTSEYENELIADHTISQGMGGTKAILLGATDVDSEGNWKWHNGEEFTYTNWAPGSPNGGNKQNWLYTHDNASSNRGKWDDGGVNGKDSSYSAYAVEYGVLDERLPKPTVNTFSELTIKSDSYLKLGEPQIDNDNISFPDAKVKVLGNAKLKITYGIGYNKNIRTEYTVNGTKKTFSGKIVQTESLSNEQLNEVLSTLKIYGQSENELNASVTLDVGQQEYLYNPINGHYYAVFPAMSSYNANKQMAESKVFLGQNGYLTTPMSKEEDDFINSIVEGDFWLGMKYDTTKNNIVYDGGYKAGEVITYEREWNKRPDENTPYAHVHSIDGESVWVYCGESRGQCNTPVYTVVEFGDEDKMPSPSDVGNYLTDVFWVGGQVEDRVAPVIEGVSDREYVLNDAIDLIEGVTATDDVDKDLTENIQITIEEVTSKFFNLIKIKKEVPTIDNNREGEYNVTYTVADYSGNETVETCVVNVDKSLENDIEIDLKNEVVSDDTISFPYARVRGTYNIINNITLSFDKGYEESRPTLKYTLKDEDEVVTTDKEITINSQMTIKEIQDLIRSIKIEKSNDKSFKFNIIIDDIEVSYVYDITDPVITGIEDIDIEKDDTFNPLEGVAISDDMGEPIINVTYKKPNGDIVENIDTSIEGEWILIYEVTDLNGNNVIVERIVNILAPIDLNVIEDKDNMKISMEGFKDIDYILYRKDNKDTVYKELGMLESIVKGKLFSNSTTYEFVDNTVEDKAAPLIGDYFLYRTREGNVKVEMNAEDIGTSYTYKVEGKNENGKIVAKSDEVSEISNATGLKGYVYLIDNNKDTEVLGSEINSKDGVFDLKNVKDSEYIHIKAIDNMGNESDTLHIKLIDETYNNKPRLSTAKNKVLNVGDTFDPMDGVTAYDYEEGNLTDRIEYVGHDKVNTKKIGSYEVEYKVSDSKGLVSTEIVTIHIAGTLDLKALDGENKINIEWLEEKNAKNYRVFRTDADEFDYKLLGEYTSNYLEDLTAIDINSPVIESIYEKDVPREKTENNETSLIVKSKDLSSTYRYFVQALDENGEIINASQIKNAKSKVGIEGFAYVIDDKNNTDAPTTVNINNIDDIQDEVRNNKSKILHIRAIDKNGNLGETVHHLIGEEYETNFIPVINGVKHLKVLKGQKINLLDGISAYDYEDENLTDKINVEHEIDFNNEGKYNVLYTVEDSDGNKREVKSSVTVYKYMNLDTKADLEKNKVMLDWENYKIDSEDVYYEIRKYNNELGVFSVIGKTEDTHFFDEKSSDIKGGKYLGYDKEILENGNIRITINSQDMGFEGHYQVFARLKSDDSIVGTMIDENGKDIYKVGSIVGGIKGYSWHLSNEKEETVDNIIEQESNILEFDSENYEWLHIAPVDIYGNKSDVAHIKLTGDEDNEENSLPILLVEDAYIIQGSNFNPRDIARAYDKYGNDLTKKIEIEGKVDTSQIGVYKLIYRVTDAYKNTVSKEINVTVYNNEAENTPNEELYKHYITAESLAEVWVHVGENYKPLSNIKVVSTKDGDITDRIKYTTNLDTNTIGDYTINYIVTDSINNSISFTRIVHVIDINKDKPTNGSEDSEVVNRPYFNNYSNIICFVGDDINPSYGVTAHDKEDGNLTDKIKMSGTVNTLKPGWYVVTFKVSDKDGNTRYSTRGVWVKENPYENPEGDKPTQNPDEGNNDNGSNGGGLPIEPEQPEQPPVEDETPSEPPIGNGDNNNNGDDIYESEGDNSNEESKPSEEEEIPNEEDKPIEGEEDNFNEESKPSEEEEIPNEENKSIEDEILKDNLDYDNIDNPKTGDKGIVVSVIGLVTSLCTLFYRQRKKK